MARIRYLHPDFFKDDEIKNLSFEARLLFAGLWCYADKKGRLEDKPERLKVEIMPYDKVNVDKTLDLLTKKPFIIRYTIENKRYIQITNWEKYQHPHHTEKESVIPEYNNTISNNSNMSNLEDKEEYKDKDKDKCSSPELVVKQPLNNGYETDIKEIFDYFVIKFNKPITYLLSTDRKNIIKKNLIMGRTVEMQKKAIDNFALDDWDGRKNHIDIVYALGVISKKDKFDRWYDYQPTIKDGFNKFGQPVPEKGKYAGLENRE